MRFAVSRSISLIDRSFPGHCGLVDAVICGVCDQQTLAPHTHAFCFHFLQQLYLLVQRTSSSCVVNNVVTWTAQKHGYCSTTVHTIKIILKDTCSFFSTRKCPLNCRYEDKGIRKPYLFHEKGPFPLFTTFGS
jgi:hypothetical protein